MESQVIWFVGGGVSDSLPVNASFMCVALRLFHTVLFSGDTAAKKESAPVR